MSAPATTGFRRHVRAVKAGPWVTLHIPWRADAQTVAFDFGAELLDRLLAAAAAGMMQPSVVEAAIREKPELRQEVAELAASPLPARYGEEPRDIVTLIINIGGHG